MYYDWHKGFFTTIKEQLYCSQLHCSFTVMNAAEAAPGYASRSAVYLQDQRPATRPEEIYTQPWLLMKFVMTGSSIYLP